MPVSEYKRQQIMNMTKEQLIAELYDIGIAACMAKDKTRANRVFAELIDSLNFDYGEIPARLFRLYQYAMTEIKKGNFDEPQKILEELKNTWKKAFNI